MAAPRVEVVGLRELIKAMRAAGVDLDELKVASSRAAATVASAASARAPRRSGRMASRVKGNNARRKATVAVNTVYAGPVHYGWPARHITAQPFVIDAAQATEPTWLPAYEAEIEVILDKIGASTP